MVDPSGAPVAGAAVILFEQNVTTFTERARRRTDGDGRFAFTDNRTHHAQLLAEQPELGRSERKTLRLWFRGRDTTVAEPLMLRP